MGPRIVIPSCLCEEYLERLHQGHLSTTKVQQNACQHLFWPGLDVDIIDYTRRCQKCICHSLPPKEPLQAHDVPHQPWECIAMDYFYMNDRLHILICDYFSRFPLIFQIKTTSFANLKDHLQELFSVEGTPEEIMSDIEPLFNDKEFSSYLTDLGIDTPPCHQTTHRVMASSRDRSRQWQGSWRKQQALGGVSRKPWPVWEQCHWEMDCPHQQRYFMGGALWQERQTQWM